jgi:hypothetical protein
MSKWKTEDPVAANLPSLRRRLGFALKKLIQERGADDRVEHTRADRR